MTAIVVVKDIGQELTNELMSPDPLPPVDALLQEDGFFIFQETGDKILLES